MNEQRIPQNFIDWACSLSGCDGGNIDADIWLCGIEWGGASEGDYYTKGLPAEIETGEVKVVSDKYDWTESLTYTYGRSFAKLYKAIVGGRVEDYREIENLKGDEVFKVNLYPIAFDSTDHSLWHSNKMDELTGFQNKYLFNTWCFFNRFPYFNKLRKDKKPKIIIGTGIDYLRDFIMFFGGGDSIGEIHSGILTPQSASNKYDRTYYWVSIDEYTTLVIIPFFSGRYGLNSNYLLQEMGEKIRALYETKEAQIKKHEK